MEVNRVLSDWIWNNPHIDDMQKALMLPRLRGMEETIAQLKAENEQLCFRECPVCGRRITVLHELAAHMTGAEPCPGSCSLVRSKSK